MSDAAGPRPRATDPSPAPTPPTSANIASGIAPVDERIGGLRAGASYLVVGPPGPAKMVAALQFVQAGIAAGEPTLLLTNADAEGILGVARAWGPDLRSAWLDGTLRIMGFKDDFELRALRSVEPEEVVEELDAMAGRQVSRVAVDPGSLFLAGGARSLLGSSFLKWARAHPATVCTTFSVDGTTAALPSSADWLAHSATGRIVVDSRGADLFEISVVHVVPGPGDTDRSVSVELEPGRGLVVPNAYPARRGGDRKGIDPRRLLLISLGGAHAGDMEAWARTAFSADVVAEPFEAIARAQNDATFAGILIHAPRARIREAVQACRALRPLTRAAVVFVSDDAVRSTDRVAILEAGADDCLSGGVDFRELGLRIRQAIVAGAKPAPAADAGQTAKTPQLVRHGPEGGRVTPDRLRSEVSRRAADPVQKFFCVLAVTSEVLDAERLEALLVDHVRADEGDLVASDEGRCTVLLQGAREAQLGPFLERLRTRLREAARGGRSVDASVTVLSHPADADRIRGLVGAEGIAGVAEG